MIYKSVAKNDLLIHQDNTKKLTNLLLNIENDLQICCRCQYDVTWVQ